MHEEDDMDLVYAGERGPGKVFVNVYEVDRIYGGPEEGGWWYDAGTLVCGREASREDAEAVRTELEAEYPNTGKVHSVLYQGGDYRVFIEDHPGKSFPEVTPHYE